MCAEIHDHHKDSESRLGNWSDLHQVMGARSVVESRFEFRLQQEQWVTIRAIVVGKAYTLVTQV